MADRRPSVWVDTILNDTITSALFTDDLNALLPATERQTVVRIILDFVSYPLNFAGNTESSQVMDMGIGVASQAAFDVAAGAGLPDPRLVAEAPARDWLWATRTSTIFIRGTGVTEALWFSRTRLDLRASRKIDKGVLFLIVAKTAIDGAEFDLTLQGRIRALILT